MEQQPRLIACNALERFECLPPLFDRDQVPPPAGAADHPQPTALAVEGKAFAAGEPLESLVVGDGCVAEQAAREDGDLVPHPGSLSRSRSSRGTSVSSPSTIAASSSSSRQRASSSANSNSNSSRSASSLTAISSAINASGRFLS